MASGGIDPVHIWRVMLDDDLTNVADRLNAMLWEDEDTSVFSVGSLTGFLRDPNAILLVAEKSDLLVGCLSAQLLLKPYGPRGGGPKLGAPQSWLYVDEVDTCGRHRRQGFAKAMMQHALALGKTLGANELWLGTEPDNLAANALYRSLNPVEEAHHIGYAFTLQDHGM